MVNIRRLPVLLTVILACLLASINRSQPAAAHGYIIRTIPDNQAVLTHAPSRIQVWFTENLEPKFSAISLSTDQGQAVTLTEMGVSPTNRAQISARLPNDLPDGAYIATIQAAFASDGHVVTDTLVFWIGQKSAGLSANGPTQDANLFEVLWRIPLFLGTILLFGATFLLQAVLLPAWGNPDYRAGMLPPRVMNRLNWIAAGALALSLFGCILALLQQSTLLFASDVGGVLERGLWNVVLISTQFGEALLWRIALLAVSGILLLLNSYLTLRQPQYVSLAWTLNAVIAA
ncbi:MAG TPA: copper resistance CopC family protein, partial [Aggregatilineales bacterium]|nr:copper resistance CopC family protein [Aggregatilineales bacterium]